MRRFDHEWQLLLDSRSWFEARGYRLVSSRGPEGMNQGLHEYAGRIGIRIVADRGQWFFDIGPMSGDALREQEAFDIETWSACLGEPTLFHDPRATLDLELDAWPEVIANSWWLEPQLDYLKRHLEQIEQLCDPTLLDGTLACLMENRARSDDVGSGFLR